MNARLQPPYHFIQLNWFRFRFVKSILNWIEVAAPFTMPLNSFISFNPMNVNETNGVYDNSNGIELMSETAIWKSLKELSLWNDCMIEWKTSERKGVWMKVTVSESMYDWARGNENESGEWSMFEWKGNRNENSTEWWKGGKETESWMTPMNGKRCEWNELRLKRIAALRGGSETTVNVMNGVKRPRPAGRIITVLN